MLVEAFGRPPPSGKNSSASLSEDVPEYVCKQKLRYKGGDMNLHGNSRECNGSGNCAKCEKYRSHTAPSNPVVDVVCCPKAEHVLAEDHYSHSLSSLFTMTVNCVSDGYGNGQDDTEVDEAQRQDHGKLPGHSTRQAFACGEEARGGEQKIARDHGQTELGFFGFASSALNRKNA